MTKDFTPKLFISIGATGAMFTLRETCIFRGRISSFHHCNLGQDIDTAFDKAIMYSFQMGLLIEGNKENLREELRTITRMKKEEREARDRAIAEREALQQAIREEIRLQQLEMIDNGYFPMGAHKGKKFNEAPDSYIRWISENVETFEEGSNFRYLAEKIKTEVAPLIAARFDKNATLAEIGKRVDVDVEVTNVSGFYRRAFSGYGDEYVRVTTMVTEDKVCVVVMSPTFKVEKGAKIKIRGTVKAHNEYKGQMQTIINRVKVI